MLLMYDLSLTLQQIKVTRDCFITMMNAVLQCIAIRCQFIYPDCFWKPIKLLRTHSVDAEISDDSCRYLANYR